MASQEQAPWMSDILELTPAMMDADDTPATLRSRFRALASRLMIGAPIAPGADAAAESRLHMLITDAIARRVAGDSSLGERARTRFHNAMLDRQCNLEAVLTRAAERIHGDSAADLPLDDIGESHDDWLNPFTRFAEDACSGEVRDRLADILVLEAKRPGTMSRASLRLAVELDDEVLAAFGQALAQRLRNNIVAEGWGSGKMLANGMLLEGAGLITGSGGTVQFPLVADDMGNAMLGGEQHGLIAQGTPGQVLRFKIWPLTRAGREIAALLPRQSELPAVRAVAKGIDKSELTRVLIGEAVYRDDGALAVRGDELVWQAPPPGLELRLD